MRAASSTDASAMEAQLVPALRAALAPRAAVSRCGLATTRVVPRQVLVDTDTPGEVCTALKEILDPWFEARSTELRPDPTVAFFGPSTDPMKASQLAAWEL